MPRRGQRDQSPGDARKPFSDRGGPQARHAETHDVRREELTNPKGKQPEDDFSADLGPATPSASAPGSVESLPADQDKDLHRKLPKLDGAELARLTILPAGTRLEQGGTYVDLNDLDAGPFKAIGGREAAPRERLVAKREIDHELWNRLVGADAETEIERPGPAQR
jgi:hypothetical protein